MDNNGASVKRPGNLILMEEMTDSSQRQGEDVAEGIFKDETDGKTTMNKYSTRKNFVCSLFDVALMLANFSQLKTVLDQSKDEQKWYYLLVVCIGVSILLQIGFAILMLFVWCIERRLERKCPHHNVSRSTGQTAPQSPTGKACCIGNAKSKCCSSYVADTLDEIGLFLVLAVIILNIIITSFGLNGNHVKDIVKENLNRTKPILC